MSVAERVVVITGAAGGLGRVVTARFAAEGAKLALFSSKAEHLEALVARVATSRGARVLTQAVDLRDPAATAAAAQAVIARFGRAEILLHLVGGWAGGTPVYCRGRGHRDGNVTATPLDHLEFAASVRAIPGRAGVGPGDRRLVAVRVPPCGEGRALCGRQSGAGSVAADPGRRGGGYGRHGQPGAGADH